MWPAPWILWICSLLFIEAPVVRAKASKGGSKACSHTGFYSKKVVPLCEKHFPEESSKNAWVVQFYHPFVKDVVAQKEAYEELAGSPDQIDGAKVGAVDCQQNGEFCQKHGILKAPTTRIMLHAAVRDFESSDHTVDAMRAFVKESLKRFADAEEALKCTVKGVFTDAAKDATQPLCTDKFPPALEPVPWLISFYESGNVNKDKTQRSVMNKLAEKYGNAPPKKVNAKKKTLKMRVGAVECTKQKGCDELGISTFPTVRFYRKGADPVDFDSFFDREEVQQFAEKQLKDVPNPQKVEVLKADMPESKAEGSEL